MTMRLVIHRLRIDKRSKYGRQYTGGDALVIEGAFDGARFVASHREVTQWQINCRDPACDRKELSRLLTMAEAGGWPGHTIGVIKRGDSVAPL